MRVGAILILALGSACIAPPPSDAGAKYALVVGIDEYSRAPHLELRGCRNDARSMAAALTRAPGGFGEENVTLLLGADGAAMRAALRNLAQQAAQPDLILLFYSGQEAVLDDRFFLLPSDGERAWSAHNLAFTEVEEILGTTAADAVVVILDTCRTGRARFSPGLEPRGFVLAAAGAGGTHVDLAGPGGEALESQAEDGSWSGFFTTALVEGLGGPADRSDDGRITVRELADFATQRVDQATRGRQVPTLGAGSRGDVALVGAHR